MAQGFHKKRGLISGFQLLEADKEVPELFDCGKQLWEAGHFQIGKHRHDTRFEISFQQREKTFWQTSKKEAREFELAPGDFYLIGPEVCHWTARSTQAETGLIYANFDLPENFPESMEVENLWRKDLCVIGRHQWHLEPAMETLVGAALTEGPWGTEVLRTSLRLVVLLLTRYLAEETAESSSDELSLPPALSQVRWAVRQKPGERWNLSDLARVGRVSESQLVRIFRQHWQTTPHRFLVEERLRQARQDLTYTEYPVTRIAYDLGFSNSQHLSRLFKEHFGLTPREHRCQRDQLRHLVPPPDRPDPAAAARR